MAYIKLQPEVETLLNIIINKLQNHGTIGQFFKINNEGELDWSNFALEQLSVGNENQVLKTTSGEATWQDNDIIHNTELTSYAKIDLDTFILKLNKAGSEIIRIIIDSNNSIISKTNAFGQQYIKSFSGLFIGYGQGTLLPTNTSLQWVGIGKYISADFYRSTIVGSYSKGNSYSVGIGFVAQCLAPNTIAIGHNARVSGNGGIAIGYEAKTGSGIAIGYNTKTAVLSYGNFVLGRGYIADQKEQDYLMIGDVNNIQKFRWLSIQALQKGTKKNIITITNDYQVSDKDNNIKVDATSNNIIIEIPQPIASLDHQYFDRRANNGQIFKLKRIDNSVNTVTLISFGRPNRIDSITDEGGDIFKYTITTGNISSLNIGDKIKTSYSTHQGNDGIFVVTGTDSSTYFEVTNSNGVAAATIYASYFGLQILNKTMPSQNDIIELQCDYINDTWEDWTNNF